jgi:hypothetical protein
VCVGGSCMAGCWIGGFVASGMSSPDNPCRACQPALSTVDYASLGDGTPCTVAAGAGSCMAGVCVVAGSCCGGEGQPCCANAPSCQGSLSCSGNRCQRPAPASGEFAGPCGGSTGSGAGSSCQSGFQCNVAGVCSCGQPGEPCCGGCYCAAGTCNTQMICQ